MIINFFSGVFERALPIKGLNINEETPMTPMRIPMSASVFSSLER